MENYACYLIQDNGPNECIYLHFSTVQKANQFMNDNSGDYELREESGTIDTNSPENNLKWMG